MIAQHGLPSRAHPVAVRYEALGVCLNELGREAAGLNAEIHMPRIGVGLGGGSWDNIEPMLITLAESVPVYVYDFRGK